MRDITEIHAWHAHVYFDPEDRAAALKLREAIGARFPATVLGRWHAVPVGPHPRAMYQIAFSVGLFPTLVPWLLLNRNGLTVLLNPETGDNAADHTIHAAWLGEKLLLRLEAFVDPTKQT